MGSIVKKLVWKRYQHANQELSYIFSQIIVHNRAVVLIPAGLRVRKINTRCLRIECQDNSYILTMFKGSIMIKEEGL